MLLYGRRDERWSVFHDFPAVKMYSTVQEWVFPFTKNLRGDKESACSKYIRSIRLWQKKN